RNTTHHFIDFLNNAVVKPSRILLNLLNGCPQVVTQLFRGERQLTNGYPDNSISFSVDRTSPQHLDSRCHIFNHSTRLRTRHQTPRTKDTTQPGLVQCSQTVGMADKAVEVD